jgi:alcohol dehydrogenase class IV
MAEASTLYAEIAADAFPALTGEEGSQARTASFIEALVSLSTRLWLPQRLRDVGIGRQDLPKLAADAMKQTRLLINNPRRLDEADALRIYEAAW